MTQNKEENTSRKLIVDNLHGVIGSPKKNIDKIVNDIIFAMIEILQKENKLNITNFGKFSVRKKKKESAEIQKLKKFFLFLKEK